MIRRFAIVVVTFLVKFFYHHKVYGVEHLSEAGGLLVSNHSSYLDPPLLGISCPYEIHFLARDTLFRTRFSNWLLRHLNTHPIARGKGNLGPFKQAFSLLKSGKKLLIFPEGTRSVDGELKKGEPGVGLIVKKTGCLVIPAYVHGTYEIWEKGRRLPRLHGRTVCVFGSSLDFAPIEEPSKKETQTKIADEIMKAIGHLKDWYLAGAKGSPP